MVGKIQKKLLSSEHKQSKNADAPFPLSCSLVRPSDFTRLDFIILCHCLLWDDGCLRCALLRFSWGLPGHVREEFGHGSGDQKEILSREWLPRRHSNDQEQYSLGLKHWNVLFSLCHKPPKYSSLSSHQYLRKFFNVEMLSNPNCTWSP